MLHSVGIELAEQHDAMSSEPQLRYIYHLTDDIGDYIGFDNGDDIEEEEEDFNLNAQELYMDYDNRDIRQSDADETTDTFEDKWREWVIDSKIPLCHTNRLLNIVRPHFPSLPKDGRTLLHTQHTTSNKLQGGSIFILAWWKEISNV